MQKKKKSHELNQGYGNVKNLFEFSDAEPAVARITEIYDKNVSLIRNSFLEIAQAKKFPKNFPKLENATYPFVGIKVTNRNLNVDHRIAFGAALEAGTYGTTLTRPDIFDSYYKKQIELLINHHQTSVVVGESDWPIPLPFVDEWDPSNFPPEQINLFH